MLVVGKLRSLWVRLRPNWVRSGRRPRSGRLVLANPSGTSGTPQSQPPRASFRAARWVRPCGGAVPEPNPPPRQRSHGGLNPATRLCLTLLTQSPVVAKFAAQSGLVGSGWSTRHNGSVCEWGASSDPAGIGFAPRRRDRSRRSGFGLWRCDPPPARWRWLRPITTNGASVGRRPLARHWVRSRQGEFAVGANGEAPRPAARLAVQSSRPGDLAHLPTGGCPGGRGRWFGQGVHAASVCESLLVRVKTSPTGSDRGRIANRESAGMARFPDYLGRRICQVGAGAGRGGGCDGLDWS